MFITTNKLLDSKHVPLQKLGWLLFDMQMKEEVSMDDVHKIADIIENDIANALKEEYEDGYRDGRNSCLCR